MDNEEIVIRIKQGEKELCAELWERVGRLIGRLILKSSNRRILPNDVDTEDLLQNGYFVMLAAVKAYDPTKQFKFNSYLKFHVQHAVNCTINHGKRSGNGIKECSYNKTVSGDDGEETELLELMEDDSTLYEYEHLEITDIQRHVWQAVSELPERLRNVILRYYFGGESLGDIAKSEGVSVSEIQRRKNDGLTQLHCCRDLRSFYREYIREPSINEPLYTSYWRTSPERYAIMRDMYERRQAGEYISYREERQTLDRAEQQYRQKQLDFWESIRNKKK